MHSSDRQTRPDPDAPRTDPSDQYQMWSTPDPPIDLATLHAVPYIPPLAHDGMIMTSPAWCAPNKIDTALCTPLASENTVRHDMRQPNVPTVPMELAA